MIFLISLFYFEKIFLNNHRQSLNQYFNYPKHINIRFQNNSLINIQNFYKNKFILYIFKWLTKIFFCISILKFFINKANFINFQNFVLLFR